METRPACVQNYQVLVKNMQICQKLHVVKQIYLIVIKLHNVGHDTWVSGLKSILDIFSGTSVAFKY